MCSQFKGMCQGVSLSYIITPYTKLFNFSAPERYKIGKFLIRLRHEVIGFKFKYIKNSNIQNKFKYFDLNSIIQNVQHIQALKY